MKMNLTLDSEVYQLLKDNAKNDYVKVATWTKQLIMKSLHERNKLGMNDVSQYGTTI